jgi:hypothetical protein
MKGMITMADIPNGYMSSLYPTELTDINVDIEQKLQYKYVKAFPSINSTNNGLIYSEPNVRWLTKQFTKKPFIIPHDGYPEKDKFKHGEPVLHGTYVDGGIANIDGYIISSSNNMNTINFDTTEDTILGTDSLGLVVTQIAQQTIIDIYNRLNDSNLIQYLRSGTQEQEQAVIDRVNNAYDRWLDTKESQVIGEVQINYSDSGQLKITEYIDNLVAEGVFRVPEDFSVYEGGGVRYYYKAYPIMIGQPNALYRVGKIDNSGKFVEDDTLPLIYFKDNFGCIFTFYNALENMPRHQNLYTHTYPYTGDNRIDMLSVKNSSGVNVSDIIDNVLPNNGDVVDFSSLYTTNQSSTRDDNINTTVIDINNIFNAPSFFKKVETKDLINSYCVYNGISPSSISTMPVGSDVLPDVLYCLPNDDSTTFGKVIKALSRSIPNTNELIPIAFMNNAGKLIPFNLDFYKDTIEQDGTHREIQTVAEGYVTFIRRVAREILGDNTSWQAKDELYTFNMDYLSNPNGDSFTTFVNTPVIEDAKEFRKNWENLFKRIEAIGDGGYFVQALSQVLSSVDVYTFFDAINSTIRFNNIYNTLIAPYVTTYSQIAWTSAYYNSSPVNVSTNKFLITKALHNLRDDAVHIYNDKYWRGEIDISHDYTVETGRTITQTAKLTVDGDLETDIVRYQNLCSYQSRPLITDVYDFRDKLNSGSITISDYEDYISYLKRISFPSRKTINYYAKSFVGATYEVFNEIDTRILIPYRITSLGSFNTIGSFDINGNERLYYDDMLNPATKADVPGTTAMTIPNGYIGNVPIDTTTLLPINTGIHNTFWIEINEGGTTDYIQQDMDISYNVSISTIITDTRPEGALIGTYGINLMGFTQSWSTYIPMVFRIFKDAEDYLSGRIPGTTESDGITIDYKFPFEILDEDMWFGTLWLSTLRNITEWNIETNGVPHSVYTDGLGEYLNARNLTIFGTDKIYGYDDNGNYISCDEYVSKISTDSANIVADGLRKEITETKNELLDVIDEKTSYRYRAYTDADVEDGTKITVKNNDFVYIQNANDYNFEIIPIMPELIEGQKVACKVTVKIEISNTQYPKVTLRLHNVNEDVQDNWTINYDSTYDAVNKYTEVEITNPLVNPLSNPITAMVELTYSASGNTCDIQFINKEANTLMPNTLNVSELSYLVHDLYSIDKLSWQQIHDITERNMAQKLWKVGDTKTFKVTSTNVNDPTDKKDFEFKATIIGFDKQKNLNVPHVIWLTNIYNNGIDISNTPELSPFDVSFACNLGIDGQTGEANYPNAFKGTEFVTFANHLSNNNLTDTDYAITIDTDMIGIMYDVNTQQGYGNSLSTFNIYAYGADYTPEVQGDVYIVLQPTYFYNPSLMEFNLTDKPKDVNTIEDNVYDNYEDVRATQSSAYSQSYGLPSPLPATIPNNVSIISRDCFAMYNASEQNWDSCERCMIHIYKNNGNFDIHSIDDVNNNLGNSVRTEFCFITI